jgi:hypothetical protein
VFTISGIIHKKAEAGFPRGVKGIPADGEKAGDFPGVMESP